MTVHALIAELENVGVRLWAEAGELRYRAPSGVMTEERRSLLRAQKAAVLAALQVRHQLVPDPENRHSPFPLTDVQAAYLLGRSQAFAYGSSACQVYTEIAYADLEPGRLGVAFRRLIARHGALRSVFALDGSQRVLESVPDYVVACRDLRGEPAETADAALLETRAEMDHHTYRPDAWPLFDLRLTLAPDRAVLHVSFDFLIADYLSIQLLLCELHQLYFEPERALSPLAIDFRDYVSAERRSRETSRYEADRSYWLERIDALPAAPELPLAQLSAVEASQRFRRLSFDLKAAAWNGLRARARLHGLTPSVAVLGAFAEVIARFSRRPDFTLNLTLLNRQPLHEHVAALVGDFTSVTLLAVHAQPEAVFFERAAALGRQLFEDMDHRLFSGIEVMRELVRRRSAAAALMPVVFTSTIGLGDAAARHGEVGYGLSQTPQLWIDCQAIERSGTLALQWDVREDVLKPGVIEAMFAAFESTLSALAADDEAWSARDLVPLPAAQRERREAANATACALPAELLHEPFLACARSHPERSAVIAGAETFRYGELLARAEAVAQWLEQRGARPGEVIAVVMNKGWEQIVAALGVLLAGGAYLPIEADQPRARRDHLLADAGVRHVLAQRWNADGSWPDSIESVAVDALAPAATLRERAAIRTPDDLAYVIYTSGSTGSPKGVMISHRSARNTIADIHRRCSVTAADRVFALASLGFDLSVYDVFGTLAAGAALVLPEAARRRDPSHWADLLAAHGVTLWNSVPAQLQMLHDFLVSEPERELPALRLALLSGDWIPIRLPDAVRARLPRLALLGLGGATEAAIWSIAYPIAAIDPRWTSVPYGKPLANQSFHVLDAALRPCPEWVAGELYIGGVGLALGYLGDPEKTAERFIVHPDTGERLYRTGDFGRYLPDGNIEFLGREDRQVKIRGHRIELAEIEAALQAHPAVQRAAAITYDTTGSVRRIAAFVEPALRAAPDDADGCTRLVEVALDAGAEVREGLDAERFVASVHTLDRAALLEMVAALQTAGLFATPDAQHSAEEILERAQVATKYQRLIRGWLAVLCEEGLLQRDGAAYRLLESVTGEAIEAAWASAADPRFQADFNAELLDYHRQSAKHLPVLMRGQLGAVQLVFPEGRVAIWEAAYRDNLLSRYVNRTAAAALREIATRQSGEGPVRILEIGAGVGGTTIELLPALDGLPVEYWFTDVSQFFLNDARERFRDRPWVRFCLFDMNKDCREQGLFPNSFDVIVNAHVMHYARHAGRALEHMRGLLCPGGWLLFIDMTRESYQIMTSMMFLGGGTADFEDHRRGTGKTFISCDEWLRLLAEAGAELQLCLPAQHDPFFQLGQMVYAAQFKRDREPIRIEALSAALRERLPDFMLPAQLQIVDALPATANGKVDARALERLLPRDEAETRGTVAEAPQDDLERRLAELCARVLGVPSVAREQSFFELGGDSLLAARFVGRMREEIPEARGMFWDSLVRQFLPQPTIAALAAHLRAQGTPAAASDTNSPAERAALVRYAGADSATLRVLLPDLSGGLDAYRHVLDVLGRDARLIGVQVADRAAFLHREPELLVQELSTEYAQLLLAEPAERYELIGFHSAGVFALEVARQLAESGASLGLAVISSYPLPARVHDELFVEYLFARGAGLDPAQLGYPDEVAVGRALSDALAQTPGEVPDGWFELLEGSEERERVAAAFQRLARVKPSLRLAAIGSAASLPDEELAARFMTFKHGLNALAAHGCAPYAGDIALLRHTREIPLWPGMRDDMLRYWGEICLGELCAVDVPGDHFDCLQEAYAPSIASALDRARRA